MSTIGLVLPDVSPCTVHHGCKNPDSVKKEERQAKYVLNRASSSTQEFRGASALSSLAHSPFADKPLYPMALMWAGYGYLKVDLKNIYLKTNNIKSIFHEDTL